LIMTRMLAGGRGGAVALVAAALCLAPAGAHAQNRRPGEPPSSLFATLKMYEVQEGTDLRGLIESRTLRVANAALVGSATGDICLATAVGGAPPQVPCAFDTVAISHVPLHRGFGELNGTFQLLYDSMPDQQLLSDLVLVADGEVHGTLDLRPLLDPEHPQPIATMEGRWRSRKLGARGTFSGTFFVPFPDPTGTCPTGYAYVDPGGPTGIQCLEANEVSLGRPVTKVIATFMKNGATSGVQGRDEEFEQQ
jgi:hypothetical protein